MCDIHRQKKVKSLNKTEIWTFLLCIQFKIEFILYEGDFFIVVPQQLFSTPFGMFIWN